MTHLGRDAGGTLSGAPTPANETDGFNFSDADDTAQMHHEAEKHDQHTDMQLQSAKRAKPHARRKPTVEDLEDWARQSGMGTGARADALGDEPEEDDDDDDGSDAIENETTDETKRFGYEKTSNQGSWNDKVKEVEELEKQDQSLRGSVY